MSMKRVIIIFILGFFCIGQIDAYTKYPKDVRKECKKLRKEGWKTFPGSKSMEEQIGQSWLMEYEYDTLTKKPKYVSWGAISDTMSSISMAEQIAYERAKFQLVSNIMYNNGYLKIVVDSVSLVNRRIHRYYYVISDEDVYLINESIEDNGTIISSEPIYESLSIISNSLSLNEFIPVIKLYKEVEDK